MSSSLSRRADDVARALVSDRGSSLVQLPLSRPLPEGVLGVLLFLYDRCGVWLGLWALEQSHPER